MTMTRGMPRVLQPGYRLMTSLVIAILMFMLSTSWLPNTGARIVLAWDPGLSKTMSRNLRIFAISQSVIGVFLAWLLLHIMYSLHYAKLYYGEIDHNDANAFRKGFAFPGNKDVVDYWDFVYYSFTIAMCFQTSAVTITLPYMRRLTIFHATVAYLFALAILGLLLDGFISNFT